MRGASTYLSTAEYLDFIRILVDGGFKTINPFKKYINNFSFYADFAIAADEILQSASMTKIDAGVRNYNTCRSVSSNFDVYITLSSQPILDLLSGAIASTIDRGFVYMNPHSNVFVGKEPLVLLHEVGHAFAGLKDEYIVKNTGDFETYVTKSWSGTGENCSSQPSWDYRNAADNKIYGSVTSRGCTMYSSGGIPRDSESYFRPSESSIMRTAGALVNGQLVLTMGDKFNVVSCGYIMAAINGQALTQAVASKYFPECKTMDTVPIEYGPVVIITLSGIGTGANSPIFSFIDSISPNSVRIPNGFKSLAKNSVLLQDAINQQLTSGKKVIVVGHSVGSLVAYNVHDKFNGKDVNFVYVDPPYKSLACKKVKAFKAICGSIMSDPNTINWTNGEAFGVFFSNLATHDPFGRITPAGEQRKVDLANKIKDMMTLSCNNSCNKDMAVVDDSLDSAPILRGVSPVSVSPDQNLVIQGSGFDPNGNNIQIENANDPNIYYDIYDVMSDANGDLVIDIPDIAEISRNVIPGNYFVKVSGQDSDWSNTVSVNLSLPPVPTVNIPSVAAFSSGSSVTITGSNFSEENNTIILNRVGVVNMYIDLQKQFANVWNSIQSWLTPSMLNAQTATTTYVIDFASSSDKTTLKFNIPSGIPSGVYEVKVGAYNTVWSNPVRIQINTVALRPLPTGKILKLIGRSASVASAKAGEVTLSWTVPSGLSIPGYNLYNSDSRGLASGPPILSNTNLTTYTVTGLILGKKYCWSVQPSAIYYAKQYNFYCWQVFTSSRVVATTTPVVVTPTPVVPIPTPVAPATLDVSNVRCAVTTTNGGKVASVTASGSAKGGTTPYTYQLKLNWKPNGYTVVSGIKSTLPLTGQWFLVWGAGVKYTVSTSGWSVEVKSKDGQTSLANCI